MAHHETKTSLSLSPEGICFSIPEANWGVKDLGLRLGVDAQLYTVRYGATAEKNAAVTATGTAGPGLSVHTTLQPVDGLNAIVVTHRLDNTSPRPIRINSATTGQFAPSAAVLHGKGGWLGWDLRYAHTDNVRTERYPHCQMEYPFLRMLPVNPVVLGEGEDQPFPSLYLRDERGRGGMLIAAASQELNYLTFMLQKAALVRDGMFAAFEIRHDFAQAGGISLEPGRSVTLDRVFIQFTGDADLNNVHDDYLAFLAARHTFRGPTTPLLAEAIHCTWNYGVFADQRAEPLSKTARFIAKNLPDIKWFLIDAGYLKGDIDTTFLDKFYPDPNQHVSNDKFPGGMRAFTDDLRKLGLRPGLWWSPTAQIDSALYQDHPEWFLRRADGGVYLIGEKNGFLDYTHPGALEYLDRTLAVILGQWGMDACKMDFWSQNFEARNARLHDPSVTAVQARARFFSTVRKHLPADGIFMTCVATGMGNPFLGQWADTYRNTIDIGVGVWHEQIQNCAWSLPTMIRPGRLNFLLNNDSVGANLEAPENENFFRFTWSFIHQGILETGGRMEIWPAKYVEAMRRCTAHADRGHAVRCVDAQAFTGAPFPRVLVVDYPEGSDTARRGIRQHIALLNWEDQAQVIGASNEQLGRSGEITVRDFWTDQRKTFAAGGVFEILPGRSARLYEVMR